MNTTQSQRHNKRERGSTCYIPGQNSDISLSLSLLIVIFIVYGMELDGCASVIYREKDDDVACRVICKGLSKSCVFKELWKSIGCMLLNRNVNDIKLTIKIS